MNEEIEAKPIKEATGPRLIFGYLGIFLVLIAAIIALPMLVVPFFPAEVEALPVFGSVSAAYAVVGLALYFVCIYKRKRTRFFRRQESSLLMLTWLAAIIAGAAPFFIFGYMGKIRMNITDAIFEAASGYSTTGLTLFEDFIDVEGAFCPHVLTFTRALMNFIGGVGLVLLVASVLGAGGGGMSLYVSEGHSDRLVPNIAKSAKLIFGIYSFYTLIGFIALMLAGMPVFDAICHSMSALSGGGFSPRAANVGSFRPLNGQLLPFAFMPVNSFAIELIIVILVIISAISFMLHTFLLRGKFLSFFRDDEIRYAIIANSIGIIVALLGALVATNVAKGHNFFDNTGELAWESVFYVIGCSTNSGFAITTNTTAFNITESGSATYLGHTFTIVLILTMLVGGGAGSSAGGIKQYRLAISARSIYYAMRYRFASSHHLYPKLTYRYGEEKELDDETVSEAHHYLFLFVVMFLALSVSVVLVDPTHYNVETAMFDVSSAVSNTGLSAVIGPAYAQQRNFASYFVTWALSIGMLLGRLEILPAAYAISNIRLEARYHKQQRQIRLRQRQKEALFDTFEGE